MLSILYIYLRTKFYSGVLGSQHLLALGSLPAPIICGFAQQDRNFIRLEKVNIYLVKHDLFSMFIQLRRAIFSGLDAWNFERRNDKLQEVLVATDSGSRPMPKNAPSTFVVPPTRRSVQAALTQALGMRAATELWQAACEACELNPAAELVGPDDIFSLTNFLEARGGLAAIVGRSAAVRMKFLVKLHNERLSKAASEPVPTSADLAAQRHLRNERLAELVRLGLLENDLDRLLQPFLARAKALLKLPVSAVNVLSDDTAHLVASLGLDEATRAVGGVPRDWSFCQYVVEDNSPFVVENTAKSKRLRNMPGVVQYNVGSYIGVPLRTQNKQVLGALCGIGEARQQFAPSEVEHLQELGNEIVTFLEVKATRTK